MTFWDLLQQKDTIMLTELIPFFYSENTTRVRQDCRKYALQLYPDLQETICKKTTLAANQYSAIYQKTTEYLDIQLTSEQALVIGLRMATATKQVDIFNDLFQLISIPSSFRQTRPDGRSGVYLMYNNVTKLTKIGVTYDIDSRITELSNACGIQLQLLHYCLVDNAYGIEASLHRQYNQYRAVGEWFTLDTTQTQAIKLSLLKQEINMEQLSQKLQSIRIFN